MTAPEFDKETVMTFTRRAALALPLLAMLAAPGAASAAKALATYGKADFTPAFNNAVGETWKRNGGHQGLNTGGNTVSGSEIPGTAPGGTFRANLAASCQFPDSTNPASYNYNKVMSFKGIPGVVANNGNGFTYMFQTQEVPDLYATYVEKYMAKRRKELEKEFKDVQVTFERKDGKAYTLTANYSYGNGVKPDKITDRLVYFMSQSTFAMCDIVTYSWIANEDIWDEYKGAIKGPISRELFVALNPLLRARDLAIADPAVSGGTWGFYNDGWQARIQNHETSMRLVTIVVAPANLNDGQVAAIKAAIGKMRPLKGASSLEVEYVDGQFRAHNLFPYEGFTGKKIMDTVQDYYDGNAADQGKEIGKAIKKSS